MLPNTNYEANINGITPYCVLNKEGELLDTEKKLRVTDNQLRELMSRMVFTRAWDERAVGLARQGRLGFYAPVAGQEATMIGSQYALNKDDFILPGYRDIPQLYWHGYPMYQAFLWSRGHQHGGQIPADVSILMPQIIIGAQYVQATGVAMAFQKRKEDKVVITYTGDGGSSQGDFYEALNFAGVFQLPVVFMVQNNRYAISTPVEKQTKAATIAQKGIAAGIKSVQVDGMDVLAVFEIVQDALKRAREGEGPTLIEALNYRIGAHSMSGDDPLRYRGEEQSDWEEKEPLSRFRMFLQNKDLWTAEDEEKIIEEARQTVTDELKKADVFKKMTLTELVETMYEEVPPHLMNQLKELEGKGGKNHG